MYNNFETPLKCVKDEVKCMTVLNMPLILVKGAVKDANSFESNVQHFYIYFLCRIDHYKAESLSYECTN